MNLRILLCAVSMLLPLTAFSQQATPAQSPAPAAVKKYSFKAIDAGGDKKISKEEAKKAGISDEEFKRLDKDNNGYITWNEVNNFAHEWAE